MKQLLITFGIIITSLVFGNTAMAQSSSAIAQVEESIKANGKYAILAGNYKHLEGAVRTGLRMRAEKPGIVFQIVLIGPVVKEISVEKHLIELVEDCARADIKIVLCQNAMKALGVDKADLHPYLETTSSGFLYIFGLQENDFKVLTL